MDLDGDGTLCFEELSLMFCQVGCFAASSLAAHLLWCQAGCIKDRDLLAACVNKLFQKLDIDNSGTVIHD